MLLYQIYHEHHSPVSGDKEGKLEKKKKKKKKKKKRRETGLRKNGAKL